MKHRNNFFLGMVTSAGLLATGWALGGAQRVVPAPRADDQRQADQLLRAKRIEIVDQTGTVLLSLGSDEQGGTVTVRDRLGRTAILAAANASGGSLTLLNTTSGQPILQTKAVDTGGSWTMHDSNGKTSLRASSSSDGSSLAINAPGASRTAILLDTTETNAGRLRTYRSDGSMAVGISQDSSQGGTIETYSAGERKLVALSSTGAGHGRIDTWGPTSANPLVSIAANSDHEGLLYTYNSAGQPLVGISTRPIGPALRLYNQVGEPVIALQCTEEGDGELGVLTGEGSGRFITP